MFFEFCIISITIICTIAMVVLMLDPAEAENYPPSLVDRKHSFWTRLRKVKKASHSFRTKPLASKEVIMAMAQRAIYNLDVQNISYEDDLWAHTQINASAVKLDKDLQNVMIMDQIVNKFFDKLEKLVSIYQEKAIECNKALGQVTDARMMLETEIYKQSFIETEKYLPTNATDIWYPKPKPSMPPQCLVEPQLNDMMLDTFSKFVDENVEQINKEENSLF